MSEEERWIDEQKKNKLFRGGLSTSPENKMLEMGRINRDLDARQAVLAMTLRMSAQAFGISYPDYVAEEMEAGQLVVDAQSRQDFMKVAIERFQGFMANNKSAIEKIV